MSLSNNWHEQEKNVRTIGNLLSDHITNFVGSWTFLTFHVAWFVIWIVLPVESFPFGLLTMIVSLEAILLSTFIMMSQNRQSDRDRVQAQADFETDVMAKKEIEEIQKTLQRLESEKIDVIMELLKKK
jgi:uncharacterized membrane protein